MEALGYKDEFGSAAATQDSLQLIAFSIGDQTYGDEITTVRVVVVMSVGEKWVGILVDAVSDFLTVSRGDIHTVPEGNSIDTELLDGIVTHENRMVGLIDLRAVVSGARADS